MIKMKFGKMLDVYNRAVKLHPELEDVEMEVDEEKMLPIVMLDLVVSAEEMIDACTKED